MREWEEIISDLCDLDDRVKQHIRRQQRMFVLEVIFTAYVFLVSAYLLYMMKGVGLG